MQEEKKHVTVAGVSVTKEVIIQKYKSLDALKKEPENIFEHFPAEQKDALYTELWAKVNEKPAEEKKDAPALTAAEKPAAVAAEKK